MSESPHTHPPRSNKVVFRLVALVTVMLSLSFAAVTRQNQS